MMLGQVFNLLGGVASSFIQGRQEIARNKALVNKAKAEAEAKVLVSSATSSAEWEKVMAQNSKDSLKDEAWTIFFILILLFNFIPYTQQFIEIGFQDLEKCPTWFQWAMYASIASSFGFRTFKGFKK